LNIQRSHDSSESESESNEESNEKIVQKLDEAFIAEEEKTNINASTTGVSPIEFVCSLQSESDPNTYYNIYKHKNCRYTCVCPHFKFHCMNKGTYCKHILGFLNGKYDAQNPDVDGYILHKDGKIDNLIDLSNTSNYEKYNTEASDVLYDGSKDVNHFTKDTVYLGWYDLYNNPSSS
jgi:hypothetical protein